MRKNYQKHEVPSVAYQVIHGNSANMRLICDAEVDLILTGPPYFPSDVEQLLKRPKTEQDQFERVEDRITEFALTLRPIFKELKRVLKPGCPFIMQTKDIRYGDFLVPLADLHQEMAIQSGFRLVTRILWLSTPGKHSRLPRFTQTQRRGDFHALDAETFMVFSHPEGLIQGGHIESLSKEDVFELIQPIWRLPSSGGSHSHRNGSPKMVIHRLIELFSEPDSLVLDPFSGYGTTLVEAKRLGRRAIGYDIELQCVTMTEDNLDRIKSVGKER